MDLTIGDKIRIIETGLTLKVTSIRLYTYGKTVNYRAGIYLDGEYHSAIAIFAELAEGRSEIVKAEA